MLEVPITGRYAHQTMTVALEGRRYRITARYNTIAAAWYLTLETTSGEMVRAGVGLTCQRVVALGARDRRAPPGVFIFVGPDRSPQEALGKDTHLLYASASEVASVVQGNGNA